MYTFTEEDRELAKHVAIARVLNKKNNIRFHDSNYHRYKEGDPPEKLERWYPHFQGLLGEIAYASLTGQRDEVNFSVSRKGDIEDFPGTEVKTRCCKDRNPLLMVKKRDFLRKKPAAYVLMRLEPDFSCCEILGQVSRKQFENRSEEMMMKGKEIFALRAEKLEKKESGGEEDE